MAFRLPPLNALRAFEAAGRLRSFTVAADELHVTPGAISRQMRTLEDHLGFALFLRSHREVKLTPDAAAYLETMSDVFDRMERATLRLIDGRKPRLLHIHNSITFTLRWLVPRLSAFHAAFPKSEIRLSTALPTAADLCASPTDVTIQIRDEARVASLPMLVHHRLVDVDLIPVCAPATRSRLKLDGNPDALSKATLLHSMMRPNDWDSWLRHAGATNVRAESGIRFESSSLALQAAIEGVGVAIANRAFITKDMESGQLVTPFATNFKDGSGFYLSYCHAAAKLPQVAEFRDWLLSEVQAQYALGQRAA